MCMYTIYIYSRANPYCNLQMDMVIARCVIPVNQLYRMGLVNIKLSVDGGKEYRFWNKFYICKQLMLLEVLSSSPHLLQF